MYMRKTGDVDGGFIRAQSFVVLAPIDAAFGAVAFGIRDEEEGGLVSFWVLSTLPLLLGRWLKAEGGGGVGEAE